MNRNCKKCQKYIPYTIKVDGKWRNLGSRKYCFDCSPFGSRNTIKILVSDMSLDEQRRINLEKYRKKGINRVRLARKALTTRLIAYKGGCCEKCGYKKCERALDFHHRDASKKEFTIRGWRRIMAWERLKTEVDKCDLICANCHREIEDELINHRHII